MMTQTIARPAAIALPAANRGSSIGRRIARFFDELLEVRGDTAFCLAADKAARLYL